MTATVGRLSRLAHRFDTISLPIQGSQSNGNMSSVYAIGLRAIGFGFNFPFLYRNSGPIKHVTGELNWPWLPSLKIAYTVIFLTGAL